MSEKFYISKKSGVVFHQCMDDHKKELYSDDKLTELLPNTFDASKEKPLHVIDINADFVTVHVGNILHPMDTNHYISFIYLETENSGYIKYLNPGDTPSATFYVKDEKLIAIYEYCTLHGLWKTDI